MPSDEEIVNLIKSAAQKDQFDKMSIEELESLSQQGSALSNNKAFLKDLYLFEGVNQLKDEIEKRKNKQSATLIFANNELRYAGFLPRLGALLLDSLILLLPTAITFWGTYIYRFFDLYYIIPSTLFGLFYSVYLVRRYGGTPGKLIVGINIRKLGGEPVGYREAFLRYFPEFVFGLVISISLIISTLHISDIEYHALSFMDRAKRMKELAPYWSKPLLIVQAIWVWGELIVLLTNPKRRALQDFIAGTVVVHIKKSGKIITDKSKLIRNLIWSIILAYPLSGYVAVIIPWLMNPSLFIKNPKGALLVISVVGTMFAIFTPIYGGFPVRMDTGVGHMNMYPYIIPTSIVLFFVISKGWRWFKKDK